MKTKKKPEYSIWSDEKRLKNVAFLLYENYKVSEKELEECRRIIEKFQKCAQSSAEKKECASAGGSEEAMI